MFNPKYEITHALLENIKRIYSLVQTLNQRRFPHTVLVELQKDAEAVSSFASTSIEGYQSKTCEGKSSFYIELSVANPQASNA